MGRLSMAWGRKRGQSFSLRKVIRLFMFLGVIDQLSVINEGIFKREVPLIQAPPTQPCYSPAEDIDHNFLARMTYGNRSKNGITMGQWNAGHGFLCNKMDEIC